MTDLTVDLAFSIPFEDIESSCLIHLLKANMQHAFVVSGRVASSCERIMGQRRDLLGNHSLDRSVELATLEHSSCWSRARRSEGIDRCVWNRFTPSATKNPSVTCSHYKLLLDLFCFFHNKHDVTDNIMSILRTREEQRLFAIKTRFNENN